MKKLTTVSKLIALTLLLPVGAANAGGLECAIQTALEGPKGAKVYLFNHSFRVEPPVVMEKQKGKHTLTGKLVYDDGTALAQEVAYRVLKEKGAVREIGLQINGGKWQAISKAVFEALGDYTRGLPMPEEKQREVTRKLEKAVDKTWLRAAEFLIANIAVRHC
jgi:hypothetical protein